MENSLLNIYCKSRTNLFLEVDGNDVILTKANPSDQSQQWLKKMKTDGSFAVVNKHDNMAMKQVNVNNTVELKKYVDLKDKSILWVTLNDKDGYSNIRIPGDSNDILAWDVKDGKAEEGRPLVIEHADDNTSTQRWMFAPLSDCSRRPGEEKTTE